MKIKTISKIGLLAAALAFGGCKDFLNPSAGTTLLEKDNYERTAQIKASFIGVAASFQQISEHWLILSELRGDLLEPTTNAPSEFWQVYNHKIEANNFLVDPSVYYKAIVNCNDFIRHTYAFDVQHPGILPKALAQGMIADALRFRAWTYLTLGKLYGEAVYYDLALVDNVEALENADYVTSGSNISPQPAVRILKLEQLVEELLGNLRDGLGKDYSGMATFNWNDLTNSIDASWNRLGVNPNALLGELYMWRASFTKDVNQDYRKALTYLIQIPNNSGAANVFTLSLQTSSTAAPWDAFKLANIFTNNYSPVISEIITYMPFDVNQKQQNKLQYYFSADSNGYYLKPTDIMVKKFDNTPKVGGYGDEMRKVATIIRSGGAGSDYYVAKFSNDKSAFSRDCPVIIYRAAEIHIMIAECLSHVGLYEEALVFLGDGPISKWNVDKGHFNYPFSNPLFSTNLKYAPGLRGRVGLASYSDPDPTGLLPVARKQFLIDSLLAEEMALECAYEGKRYFYTMRLAMMYDKPEYFAEIMSAKYGAKKSEYYDIFMDKDNWFIKYDQNNL